MGWKDKFFKKGVEKAKSATERFVPAFKRGFGGKIEKKMEEKATKVNKPSMLKAYDQGPKAKRTPSAMKNRPDTAKIRKIVRQKPSNESGGISPAMDKAFDYVGKKQPRKVTKAIRDEAEAGMEAASKRARKKFPDLYKHEK